MDSEDAAELRERFIEEDYGDGLVADIYTPFTVTASAEVSVAELARTFSLTEDEVRSRLRSGMAALRTQFAGTAIR